MAKVFFALWPDEPCADRLGRIGGRLAAELGGRAMRKSTLHLTLAYVGDVGEVGEVDGANRADTAGDGRLAGLLALGRAVAEQSRLPAPLALQLDCLGYWRHNHILWAGCERVPAGLGLLAARLADALRAGGQPLPQISPARPFAPHVTLVRKLAAVPDARALEALKEAPQPWLCDEFALLASAPTESGAAYRTLASWKLCASPPAATPDPESGRA